MHETSISREASAVNAERSIRRIMVVGSCGTGKSTVARSIGKRLGLPVIHLDAEFWKPGWVEPARHDWRLKVAQLAARPAWVMDGQYSATWDLRVPFADAIVWLDLPRSVYLWRVLERTVLNYGRVRSDLAEGCPERFDWQFLKWVWTYPTRSRPKVAAMLALEAHNRCVVILQSASEVAIFLEQLPHSLGATAGHLR